MLKHFAPAVVAAWSCSGFVAHAQTFDFFRATPPGGGYAAASGVSADGQVVSGLDGARGFVWTRDSGIYRFGDEPGVPGNTFSYGISGNGSTVVGAGITADMGRLAYRWRGPGTYQVLGAQAGYSDSYAKDANFDGSVVVGRSQDRRGFVAQAFRWTEEEGMRGLGFLPNADWYSEAMAVSADGNTVVGYSLGSVTKAFVWTASGGMQELPGLAGDNSVQALGCSSGGDWAVGASFGRGVRWHDGVLESLGLFGAYGTRATGITDNGELVSGAIRNYTLGFDVAALWSSTSGWTPLSEYLADNGVSVPSDWILRDITGMSADGRIFTGTARASDGAIVGYVASVPAPGTLSMLAVGVWGSIQRKRRTREFSTTPLSK